MPEPLKLIEPVQTPLTEYCRFFPGHTPSCYQQDLIDGNVTDMVRWRTTLEFWAGNDYRPQSIQKMIDYYEKLDVPKRFEPGRPAPDLQIVAAAVCETCGSDMCLRDHRYDSQRKQV